MYTVTIGRTFLKGYNQRYNKEYSAKDFFEKEYFELFFNNSKYMQWATNSPFVQMKTGQKVEKLTSIERHEKLTDFHEKVSSGEKDASIAIGFAASDLKEFATTSGQVTDIDISTSEEDVYLSWIGGGLSLGVSGGYALLFNNEQILHDTYIGWQVYRDLLNDRTLDLLRPNQITTWNGQWLNFMYSRYYTEDFDFNTLNNFDIFKVDTKVIEVKTVLWSKVYFNISRKSNDDSIIGYIYSLGQMNKTLGFFPFLLTKARNIFSFYRRLFGESEVINNAKVYEELFGVHIVRACELGSFGLKALEPKMLNKYYGNEKSLKFTKPGKSDDDGTKQKIELETITYRTYKTWLLAMITKNKEESLEYSLEIAGALHSYRNNAKKTDRINLIKNDILGTKSKKVFLDALTKVVEDLRSDGVEKSIIEQFKQLRDRVYLMNNEDFGYFVVLLKFDFSYIDE
ncbi:MAG: hypothetical protein R3Y26_10155 [Rikenellaceae bacterium]